MRERRREERSSVGKDVASHIGTSNTFTSPSSALSSYKAIKLCPPWLSLLNISTLESSPPPLSRPSKPREGMQEKEEKKRRKVKKGWLTVTVGTEVEAGGFRRFVIPISYLYHPLFTGLLDSARDTYGFPSSGPLALPCSVDDFLHLRWLIERETQPSVSALTGRMRDRLIGCLSLSHGLCL